MRRLVTTRLLFGRAAGRSSFTGERGQVLVLFAVMFVITLGVAAFAVDQGMWLSKRRTAQKDADVSARGGVYALLANPADPEFVAESNGRLVADQNDVPRNLTTTFTYDDVTCQTAVFGDWDVPSLHVEINDPAGSLFGRVLGIDGMSDLGAEATACIGEPGELEGIDPFFIAPNSDRPEPECFDQNDEPRLGSICAIMGPAHFHDVGQRGTITLQDDPTDLGNNETECTQPSGNDLDGHVVSGSNAICGVGDEVHTDGGTFNNVDASLRCRLLGWDDVGNDCPNGFRNSTAAPGEGFCDSEFAVGGTTIPPFGGNGLSPAFAAGDVINSPGGVDDFQESFTNPATGGPPTSYDSAEFLVPNMCNGRMSPRIVTIVLAEQPVDQQGGCTEISANGCVVIEKFAMFFILGCRDVDGPGSFNFTGQIDPFCDNINAARTALVGIFVKAFIPEGGGPLTRCDAEGIIGCSIVLVK